MSYFKSLGAAALVATFVALPSLAEAQRGGGRTGPSGGGRAVPSGARPAPGGARVTGTAVARTGPGPYHGGYRGGPYYAGRPYYGGYYGGYYRPYPCCGYYGGYGYPYYGGSWSIGVSVGYGYPFYGPYAYAPFGWGAYGGWGWGPYAYPAPYVSGYPAYAVRPYGAIRLDLPQRDAEVWADGYFLGVVNQFDGALQSANLEDGPHRIEVRKPGFETIAFDVNVQPGRTITYRSTMRPTQP